MPDVPEIPLRFQPGPVSQKSKPRINSSIAWGGVALIAVVMLFGIGGWKIVELEKTVTQLEIEARWMSRAVYLGHPNWADTARIQYGIGQGMVYSSSYSGFDFQRYISPYQMYQVKNGRLEQHSIYGDVHIRDSDGEWVKVKVTSQGYEIELEAD